MSQPSGLRELKKERTRHTLSHVAISLFLRYGFERVSVAEVAAAAEVSKPTLFRYFPAKEDLALYRFADHQGESSRVVRDRAAGQAPLDALHRHLRGRLRARDPITGLNDQPDVLGFHQLLYGTPSLRSRILEYTERDRRALADALHDTAASSQVPPSQHEPRPALDASLAAGQIMSTRDVLARANYTALAEGLSADERAPVAEAAADRAYTLLRSGLATRYG